MARFVVGCKEFVIGSPLMESGMYYSEDECNGLCGVESWILLVSKYVFLDAERDDIRYSEDRYVRLYMDDDGNYYKTLRDVRNRKPFFNWKTKKFCGNVDKFSLF